MTDRPIIFSDPGVRTLLEGRKAQTRRVIKPAPDYGGGGNPRAPQNWNDLDAWGWEDAQEGSWRLLSEGYTGRPCYRRGDRLWVREAWQHEADSLDDLRAAIEDAMGDSRGLGPYYRATEVAPETFRWRSPIHMPRFASRLTLVVNDVRVQRLQEIIELDAHAEGTGTAEEDCFMTFTGGFRDLWNSLHGPGAWHADPWVAALTFSVHRCNIDDMR